MGLETESRPMEGLGLDVARGSARFSVCEGWRSKRGRKRKGEREREREKIEVYCKISSHIYII